MPDAGDVGARRGRVLHTGTGTASGIPAAGSTEAYASSKNIGEAGAAAIAKALAALASSFVTKVCRR